tara:strand:- start:31078 stop:32781 length:1704 start_codon:yes stop_codon:yes gene_type:complete
MSSIYKNRMIINQRGGSIDIDNTTEREKVKLSHRSGSNINLTNVVNSELATNNKQMNVIRDSFETIGNDKTSFVAGTKTERVGGNSYNLKGFTSQFQIDAMELWKETYRPIANLNSEFKINRGGVGFPNGATTSQSGDRADNPVIDSKVFTVENKFNGYTGIPYRTKDIDEVTTYVTVPDRNNTKPAEEREIQVEDIEQSAGSGGSNAPGVLEFGSDKSAATENGEWSDNDKAQEVNKAILELQDTLTPIEQLIGDGDETHFTKRNKFEQIGGAFNDFPSIRIDPKGRSQPLEMLVSETGTFKNHDYVPHVEEVDNSSNFLGGNDDKLVSNRYSRNVGSGGIQLKTTGNTELGGATLKAGFTRININASHGVQLASESFVEIQSLKTITLRTNRQVYVESSLGIKGNTIIGGGASIEGELYVQHITAPLEVQQTQDTTLYGKFATDEERRLIIGECQVGDVFYPVYASAKDNLIVNYPHSHHYNSIPIRLTQSNKDVRNIAAAEGINDHTNITQALPQIHERKLAVQLSTRLGSGGSGSSGGGGSSAGSLSNILANITNVFENLVKP